MVSINLKSYTRKINGSPHLLRATTYNFSISKRNHVSSPPPNLTDPGFGKDLEIYPDEETKTISKLDSKLAKIHTSKHLRQTKVSKFLAHGNHTYPSAISEFGRLRKAVKNSDIIVACLSAASQSVEEDKAGNEVARCSAVVKDDAALVHSLDTKTSKTFSEYCTKVFSPAIDFRLRKFGRVDVVFDSYFPGSLKADTRLQRGVITIRKLVICTDEELVTSVDPLVSSDDLAPCPHEEAYTRFSVHVRSAFLLRHKNIWMSTVDSDVIVIADASSFHELKQMASAVIVTEEDFIQIQLFTVLMYDDNSQTETLNECRRVLYTQKNRSVENIPPTAEALRQHLRQAMLQCVFGYNV
ncbi:hypothetical protein JTB14_008101 [Gonioctena quinquepunctata]|nr:hypothetical protein JTB14_008101 [Gonioctena quinquepunctata]